MLKINKGIIFATISPEQIQIRKPGGEIFGVEGQDACRLLGEIIARVESKCSASEIADDLTEIAEKPYVLETVSRLISSGVLLDESNIKDKQYSTVQVFLLGPSDEIGKKLLSFLSNLGLENVKFQFLPSISDVFKRLITTSSENIDLLSVADSGTLLISWFPRTDFSRNENINNYVVEHKLHWLPVDFFSEGAGVIGPYIYGGGKPCYECYQTRRLSNRGDAIGIDREFCQFQMLSKVTIEPPTEFPFSPEYLFSTIAVEIAKLIHEHTLPATYQSVQIVDALAGTIETQRVLTLPRCGTCRSDRDEVTGHWAGDF